MKIVIVNYGMGNIKSILSALKYLGINDILVSNRLTDINLADRLILPGVGSFSKAMENIKSLNLDKHLYDAVIINKKPILGICLGMQLMGSNSSEDGYSDGLKFVNANIKKFSSQNLKVPHIGFNQVEFTNDSRLYKGLKNMSDFYFVHSFKMTSKDNINQSLCDYGEEFIASFEKENIVGVQFHPELSQTNGLKLLDNFIKRF